MSHVTVGAHRLLAEQHGVAAAEQLIAAGLSRRRIEYLVWRGDLVAVIRGVYRSPSVPVTEVQRCAAVCLAHPRVAIAGATAGRLWGFRRTRGDRRIHVLAPRHFRATGAPWCVAYRTDAVGVDDVLQRPDGIRVTSRARTVLDLSRHIESDDVLLSVIEQAARDGGLHDGDLRAVALHGHRRRAFARRYLDQLDRRLAGGAAESEPEVRVGDALRRAGIHGLIRQHGIDLPGYGAARFDLAIPELRWALEVDVFPTHSELLGRERDRRRDLAAAHIGWTVRRMSADAYYHRFDQTIADVTHEVRARLRAA